MGAVLTRCLTYNVSPRGTAVCLRDSIHRVPRLCLCLGVGTKVNRLVHAASFGSGTHRRLRVSHIGAARKSIRGRVFGRNGGRDMDTNLLACPALVTTSVVVRGTIGMPMKGSRRRGVRVTHHFTHHFGTACKIRYFPRPTSFCCSGGTVGIPKLSKSNGVKGDRNGTVCLVSSRGAVGGGIVGTIASTNPARPGDIGPRPVTGLFAVVRVMSAGSAFSFFGRGCGGYRVHCKSLGGRLTRSVGGFYTPVHRHVLSVHSGRSCLTGMTHVKTRGTDRDTTGALHRIHRVVKFEKWTCSNLLCLERKLRQPRK